MRGIGSGSIRTVLDRLGPIAKALVCEGLMILVDFKEHREVDGRKQVLFTIHLKLKKVSKA